MDIEAFVQWAMDDLMGREPDPEIPAEKKETSNSAATSAGTGALIVVVPLTFDTRVRTGGES